MAGEGGGGVTEPGFLNIPSFTLAGMLTFFLLCSIAFEKSTRWLVAHLKKRKRNGLAQAVENLVTELTLVGFIALLLTVLQSPISHICVSYTPSTYSYWNLLSNVEGCDCCLAHTASVASCFQAQRECGPGYCNCEGEDPACLASAADSLGDLLAEWEADPACGAQSACGADFLERAQESPEAVAALEKGPGLECEGEVALDTKQCGPGSAPLISITAQHQLHIFLFVVALTHVVMGIVMVLLSSWRVRMWRRACHDEDDVHATSVRKLLDSESSQAPASTRWRSLMHARLTAFSNRLQRTLTMSPAASGPASPTAQAASPVAFGAAVADAPDAPQGPAKTSLFLAAVQAATAAKAAGLLPADPPGAANGAAAAAAAAADPAAPAEQAGDGSTKSASLLGGDSSGGSVQKDSSSSGVLAKADGDAAAAAAEEGQAGGPPAAAELASQALPPPPTNPGSAGGLAEDDGSAEAPPAAGKQGSRAQRPAFLARSATLKPRDYRGWLRELLICTASQLNPRPVAPEDVRLMRASFMLTHRVPQGFDFWQYIEESMEDDFAQIVGVNLEMWVTLVIFVLISGPLGWAALLFICLAAALLLVVNVKLISIIRHVCRGCRVNQLSKDVFWFGKPALLLHPIKFILFLCSFVFASAIFFVWSFGPDSCPFTSQGGAFWFAWRAPWWVSLVVTGVIFLDASMRTLPCYSLAVQMGSDFKHHMLPKGVREKLLAIAQHIKQKHKAQRRAAAAAEGSVRGGMRAATEGAKEWLGKQRA